MLLASGGHFSEDRHWWWNGREWIPAGYAPAPKTGPPAEPAPSSNPVPLPRTPPPLQRRGRALWWLLGGVGLILLLGVCTVAISSAGSRERATAAQQSSAAAPGTNGGPSAAGRGGACSPQPCANDSYGWIVTVGDLKFDAQPGQFEHAEPGNVYVTMSVSFANRLRTERHADPFQFVLRDGAGVKHTATFIQTCPLWSAVNVTTGASYGPKCLVFQAAGDKPAGLVLVWTPRPGGGDYNIKLS